MEYLKAFLVGGAICAVGQLLLDKTKLTPELIDMSDEEAKVFLRLILTSETAREFLKKRAVETTG